MKYITTVLLLWALCESSCLLHELGHALGHRLGGRRGAWKILVGSGATFLNTERLSLRVFPMGGYYLPEIEEESKREKLLMLAGGPLVSLLLALLYGLLRFAVFPASNTGDGLIDWGYVSSFLFLWNLFQFLFTALPLRYRIVNRGQESDGRQFLSALKS